MTDTYPSRLDLADKAKDMVRDAKAKASELTDGAMRAAKDNAAQLGDAALEMANSAKEKVEANVTQRKSIGADYLGSIAQAAGRSAKEFEADLPQAAHYIRQASAQIQGVADNVRGRDVRELVAEVQDFARRQPTLFFGGAVVLGFAALRFLKSSAPEDAHTSSSQFEARREG
jgi:hypothetical protein